MDKKLSNKAIKSWILGRTIGLIVLVIIYLGIIFVLPKMDIQWADYILNNHMRIVNILSFIILGITALSAYIEPFFEYKQWSYRIDEEEIFFTEGVFFKRSVTIPIVRIQNINLSEGPVNRKFNLADVKIGTAGEAIRFLILIKRKLKRLGSF